MAVRVEVSDRTVGDAMRTATVRKALKKKADQKQARAEAIARAEAVALDSQVVEGIRPRGRPYARVQTTNVGQEWGDRHTERKRILGRAANS